MSGPLHGLRVLDLSRIMAGPWAGQILADLGAEVIKIERPDVGDDTRSWGPPFVSHSRSGTRSSGYFLSVNRGKRSVAVDLATPEGQETVRAIADRCDILIENFKVDTLQRFGLDYDTLSATNPRLIYCSITGFGQTGPRRSQPAYDFMIQAMGGLMSITGRADGEAGGGPQKVGLPIVDIMTGMYASVAILAALEARHRTGKGDCIDLAMLDVHAAFLANQAMNYIVTGSAPRRTGNRHPNIQPQNVYACSEGHLALAVGNDMQFRALCQVLGEADLADDPRFSSNAGRVENLPALEKILERKFAEASASEWDERLQSAGVPAGRINSIAESLNDPQIIHRAMVQDLPRPDGDTSPAVVSPMKFRNSPLVFDRAPPDLGADTAAVLSELGLGGDQ